MKYPFVPHHKRGANDPSFKEEKVEIKTKELKAKKKTKNANLDDGRERDELRESDTNGDKELSVD